MLWTSACCGILNDDSQSNIHIRNTTSSIVVVVVVVVVVAAVVAALAVYLAVVSSSHHKLTSRNYVTLVGLKGLAGAMIEAALACSHIFESALRGVE